MPVGHQKPSVSSAWQNLPRKPIPLLGLADAHAPGFRHELAFVSKIEYMRLGWRSSD
jgi:hypothetical protein